MALTPQQVADKTFTSTRLKVGYNEDEVDAFLDEVEGELTRLYAENAELRARLAASTATATLGTQVATTVEAKSGKRGGNPFAVEMRRARPGDGQSAVDGSEPEVEPEVEPEGDPGAAVEGDLTAAADLSGESSQPEPSTAVALAPSTAVAPPLDDDIIRRTLILAQKTADEAVSQAREEAARLVADAMDKAVGVERQAQLEHQSTMAAYTSRKEALESEISRLRAFEREYRTRLKAYLEMQLRDLMGPGSPGAAPAVGSGSNGAQNLEDDIADAEEIEAEA